MAQFFFHFHDAEMIDRDEIGIEFASAEEAYLEAVAAARAMWPELLAQRRDPQRCAFEVAAADGQTLFQIPFSELLDGCRASASAEQLHNQLHETHLRAQTARQEVWVRIDRVRSSLNEMASLTGRLPMTLSYGRRTLRD